MNRLKDDESFLARWAENRLTPEELTEFESRDDFTLFDRINKEVSSFAVTSVDLEKDYKKLNTKISSDTKKSKNIHISQFYYIAATVALLVSVVWFLNSSKTIVAGFGEKVLADLPDGSKVHINAGSEIQYKRFFWNNNREVSLNGEAYFDVLKGDTNFKVNSESGQVLVLGTKFNITDRNQRFEVVCYSGKVSVTENDSNKEIILQKGDRVLFEAEKTVTNSHSSLAPSWKNGFSVFNEEPLSNVLESLERQYNIKVETNEVDTSVLFTGSFAHNDVSLALRTTLPVLGIDYNLSSDKKTVSLKNNP